ncbi:MAG: sigma54 specific transcriptional regulator, Fis family [Myxococcales bacterium]|nr:sigma54 specific transcriptional regulator, Fis family [Myxococcales bacterium]
MLEDLGSRNGTLVNGATISAPRRLSPGDIVTIGPASVVVATSSAVRRARQVASAAELEDRLDAEVDRAARYRRPLGLVMLRLEGPTERVLAHVDTLLRQMRRMDMVAEYGTDELALVLPEAGPEAVGVVAKRASKVGEHVAAAAGYATFPEDGSHAGELISVARERLRGARTHKRGRTVPPENDGDVIVIDPLMKHVFELAQRAAASPITVLIAGETGAGKEMVAAALHRLGPRAKGPYVRLNCAALPDSLVEAELFGHEKGAFTGATAQKLGYFEAASGGTLFLDEIGELPLAMQVKLLRVIEQRKIVRLGGTKELSVDVRLVCATNRDLELEVSRGRFRADLYFRISAFVIPVPPLRDRRTEIRPLATRFARELSAELGDRIASISADALESLESYDWPGNVRELRNVIERAVVLSGGSSIELRHLPDRLREQATTEAPLERPFDVRQRVAEVEREAVVAALDATAGNQTQAARKLGISRFALIRLMEKHELKSRR